jgi:phosphate transport system substrate-binding protein
MRRNLVLAAVLLLSMLLTACSPVPPTPTVAPTAIPATKVAAAPTAVPATKAVEPTKPAPTAVPPKVAPTTVPATKAAATGAGTTLPKVDPLQVKGTIVSAGSSTVFPLSERMAEKFKDEGYSGKITIDSIGSGAGFERFCKTGETDIANASRKIKDAEVELARKIGREPVEFRVGTDALSVVVSKDNKFLTNVTMAQLTKIYTASTELWSDVDPTWPKEPIKRFSPGTDSGTFDYFVEVVMGTKKEAILKAKNLQLSEDDNVLVQGVEGSPYAIGYFGYAYYQENASKLNVLSINGVVPSAETVDNTKYPLSRPLFLYTTAKIMKDKPQVASFINYYLSNVNAEIRKVGYFPASADVLEASKKAWAEAMK